MLQCNLVDTECLMSQIQDTTTADHTETRLA